MYHSTFAHLNNDYQLPTSAPVAPVRRNRRRGSATLPLWRNHPSLLRARVSQR
jgi:hypothetical protein